MLVSMNFPSLLQKRYSSSSPTYENSTVKSNVVCRPVTVRINRLSDKVLKRLLNNDSKHHSMAKVDDKTTHSKNNKIHRKTRHEQKHHAKHKVISTTKSLLTSKNISNDKLSMPIASEETIIKHNQRQRMDKSSKTSNEQSVRTLDNSEIMENIAIKAEYRNGRNYQKSIADSEYAMLLAQVLQQKQSELTNKNKFINEDNCSDDSCLNKWKYKRKHKIDSNESSIDETMQIKKLHYDKKRKFVRPVNNDSETETFKIKHRAMDFNLTSDLKIYLIRLENMTQNPYVLNWKIKTSKDTAQSFESNCIVETKKSSRNEGYRNFDNISILHLNKNLNHHHEAKQRSINLKKSKRVVLPENFNKYTSRYKLLKEPKVFLVKFDKLLNFTQTSYSALGMECVIEKYIDFLINSNFPCSLCNVSTTDLKQMRNKKIGVNNATYKNVDIINNTSDDDLISIKEEDSLLTTMEYMKEYELSDNRNISLFESPELSNQEQFESNSDRNTKDENIVEDNAYVPFKRISTVTPKSNKPIPTSVNMLNIWRNAFRAKGNEQTAARGTGIQNSKSAVATEKSNASDALRFPENISIISKQTSLNKSDSLEKLADVSSTKDITETPSTVNVSTNKRSEISQEQNSRVENEINNDIANNNENITTATDNIQSLNKPKDVNLSQNIVKVGSKGTQVTQFLNKSAEVTCTPDNNQSRNTSSKSSLESTTNKIQSILALVSSTETNKPVMNACTGTDRSPSLNNTNEKGNNAHSNMKNPESKKIDNAKHCGDVNTNTNVFATQNNMQALSDVIPSNGGSKRSDAHGNVSRVYKCFICKRIYQRHTNLQIHLKKCIHKFRKKESFNGVYSRVKPHKKHSLCKDFALILDELEADSVNDLECYNNPLCAGKQSDDLHEQRNSSKENTGSKTSAMSPRGGSKHASKRTKNHYSKHPKLQNTSQQEDARKFSDTKCSICSQVFDSMMSLSEHIYKHTESELIEAYMAEKAKLCPKEAISLKVNENVVPQSSKAISSERNENEEPQSSEVTSFEQKENEEPRPSVAVSSVQKENEKPRPSEAVSSVLNENAEPRPSNEKKKTTRFSTVPSKVSKNTTRQVIKSITFCECHSDEIKNCIEIVLLCETCNVVYRHKECFKEHFDSNVNPLCRKDRTTTRIPKLLCCVCRIMLKSFSDLKIHLKNHIKPHKNIKFLCRICKLYFSGMDANFQSHWYKHKENVCYVFDALTFLKELVITPKDKNVLTIGKNEYGITIEYICRTCKTRFESKDGLQDHKRLCKAHQVQPNESSKEISTKKFVCRFCGMCFETEENLSKHNNGHREEKSKSSDEQKNTVAPCNTSTADTNLNPSSTNSKVLISNSSSQISTTGSDNEKQIGNHAVVSAETTSTITSSSSIEIIDLDELSSDSNTLKQRKTDSANVDTEKVAETAEKLQFLQKQKSQSEKEAPFIDNNASFVKSSDSLPLTVLINNALDNESDKNTLAKVNKLNEKMPLLEEVNPLRVENDGTEKSTTEEDKTDDKITICDVSKRHDRNDPSTDAVGSQRSVKYLRVKNIEELVEQKMKHVCKRCNLTFNSQYDLNVHSLMYKTNSNDQNNANSASTSNVSTSQAIDNPTNNKVNTKIVLPLMKSVAVKNMPQYTSGRIKPTDLQVQDIESLQKPASEGHTTSKEIVIQSNENSVSGGLHQCIHNPASLYLNLNGNLSGNIAKPTLNENNDNNAAKATTSTNNMVILVTAPFTIQQRLTEPANYQSRATANSPNSVFTNGIPMQGSVRLDSTKMLALNNNPTSTSQSNAITKYIPVIQTTVPNIVNSNFVNSVVTLSNMPVHPNTSILINHGPNYTSKDVNSSNNNVSSFGTPQDSVAMLSSQQKQTEQINTLQFQQDTHSTIRATNLAHLKCNTPKRLQISAKAKHVSNLKPILPCPPLLAQAPYYQVPLLESMGKSEIHNFSNTNATFPSNALNLQQPNQCEVYRTQKSNNTVTWIQHSQHVQCNGKL